MSAKSVLESYYNDTRLSEQVKEDLKEFSVAEPIAKSYSFIRENFREGFLYPYLWRLLVGFVHFLFLGGMITVWVLGVLTSPDTYYIEPYTMDPVKFWGWIASLFAVSMPFYIFYFYLDIRQMYLLNNKSIKGIWFKGNTINKLFGKALLSKVLIVFTTLPGYILGFLAIMPYLSKVLSNPDPAIGDFIIIMLISLLVVFVMAIVQLVITSFLGLSTQLIVQERQGVIESFKKSFRISKMYYFLNIARWILFGFIIWLISAVNSGIQQVFSGVFDITTNPEGFDEFIGSLAIFMVITAVVGMIFQFIIKSFYVAFDYLAFYNFRVATLEEVEGENKGD